MAGHTIHQITGVLIRYVRPNLLQRMLHKRNPSQEVFARLKEMFQRVFIVPDAYEIYEAQREGIPISHYAPTSRAAKAYAKIAQNIRTNATQK